MSMSQRFIQLKEVTAPIHAELAACARSRLPTIWCGSCTVWGVAHSWQLLYAALTTVCMSSSSSSSSRMLSSRLPWYAVARRQIR